MAEIDRIKVSDKSLMPEGIEKDVTPQQMEDLLEFLKGRDCSDSRNAVTAANCIGDEECFQIRTPARRNDDASKGPLFCRTRAERERSNGLALGLFELTQHGCCQQLL